MRSRKALINIISNFAEELIAIICAFILPKLILLTFGSSYNGIVTSITQFLSCAVLLRSGIGGATRAALYKPLANNDTNEINSIIKATDIFMKKVALFLVILIFILAIIYPFFIINDFSWLFTFSLFLIISASTFAESFFGITYLILLQADQKVWISSILKSFCYILNLVVTVMLIKFGSSIHIIKLGSSLIFILYPIVLGLYVKRKYNIKKNVEPNNLAISQRWDSFWHQVSTFVMNNTDIMVLTAFSNLLEVSVYSVYNLVMNAIKRFLQTFSNVFEAAFGNMIARKEEENIRENLSIIEMIMFSIATIIYTCCIILIIDFVRIYTVGIEDVNYIRPAFAFIMLVGNYFYCIRIPYQIIVQAAGHYKQTKKGAMLEPILNIILSIIFVYKFGIIGVAIGTLVSTFIRTFQYYHYVSKNIITRNYMIILKNCFISIIEGLIIIFIVKKLYIYLPTNYIGFIGKAMFTLSISFIIVIIGLVIFYNKDLRLFIKKFLFIKKKKGSN